MEQYDLVLVLFLKVFPFDAEKEKVILDTHSPFGMSFEENSKIYFRDLFGVVE